MLAYRLRHRITFQEQVETRDSNGNTVIDWENVWLDSSTELDSVPAEVLTGAGREFMQSDSKQNETTARINLRWFPADIHEMYKWRILWNGMTYNIESVEMDATARREYRLKCSDGVNDGQ